ncbi:NAD(P)-dependent dehydrogenase, short-chain alcohol dehydrogenase family [Faunimonas pinastri]|uniref:NAD(P)-dependent dehydrogenase, short-chain alcohol dehydrogenase family n=1 Tax=Faunimonas pinastri TaxID=1855383 RepID=A0A1H9ASH0_9HYPH|nr:SDR family oxidoreductase [Faunimonas pinastri]SEP79353.1 NAD(P)-dependent dehydrogenase, short-chain alcohol dehydrogenase family [Faunimonas pinastri]
MDLGIRGRTALITGGDSGMGLSTAEFLIREGVRIVLSDRSTDQLRDAATKLEGLGDVLAVTADLTRQADVDKLRRAAEERFGAPDILVHAAGVTGATGDFLDLDDVAWETTLQTDLMAAVRVCRAFIPGMRIAGWGRVVLFSSEDAVQPYPDELPYCACKAAVNNLAKGLSKAYSPDGVLINTVAPAFVATPMTDKMMEKRATELGVSFDRAVESFLDEERPGIAAKRRGRAEEVAAVVAFMCSAHASFMTGSNVRVDGGSVMTV